MPDFTDNYLKQLEKNAMIYVVVVPIPFVEKDSFIIFTNTKNRDFTFADIEMILLSVKRIGLELKHFEDEKKIKEQEHAFALAEGMRTVVHQVGAPLAAIHNQLDNLAKGRIPQELISKRSVAIGHQIAYSKRQLTSFQRILELDVKPIIPVIAPIENFTSYLIYKSMAFRAMAESKGIHIRVKNNVSNEKFDNFYTDEKLLDEVLTCLLDNAVKYSFKSTDLARNKIKFDPSYYGSDGNILIDPNNNFSELTFSVTNWGCQILEDEKTKIFQRHFRGSYANEFSPLGSGLGLYLVKKIVEALNGKIEVLTEKNKATFFVKFKK
ncbi:hypothetical protein DR864_28455 (plasmid) [Runella rosea]|uniref:histidine kinase n=1 Tax=Runella rosea TaxID=2259595 RepID=A0A344TT36_9BACT|nr:HAMP domain-containing sensor histidine kinase [Runella rosea]AXE21807.1 hypothetical protein DR864_28455 [Runella rosea]